MNSEAELSKLKSIIHKHGICTDCGDMYSHHGDEPVASCSCKSSEWYNLTPYMELESKLKKSGQWAIHLLELCVANGIEHGYEERELE